MIKQINDCICVCDAQFIKIKKLWMFGVSSFLADFPGTWSHVEFKETNCKTDPFGGNTFLTLKTITKFISD